MNASSFDRDHILIAILMEIARLDGGDQIELFRLPGSYKLKPINFNNDNYSIQLFYL